MGRFLSIGIAIGLGMAWAGQSMAAPAPNVLVPQAGVGAKYGARDPLTCSTKTAPQQGAISAELATQYFICQFEKVNGAGILFLAANVHLQVGKTVGRARDVIMFPKDADPDSPVYPIRGSFDEYLCSVVDNSYPPDASGHNCALWHETKATGQCYRTGFGDWSCMMVGSGSQQIDGQPPPGFVAASAAGKAPAPAQAGAAPAAPWTSATSGLPPVAAQAAPAKPVTVAQQPPVSGNIQDGMQRFQQGDYRGAYGKFHAAVEGNPNDPLAKLWEGVALEALGGQVAGNNSGWDFLQTTDPKLGVASSELLALLDWHRGDRQNAEAVLKTCIQFHPDSAACADMKQGVESGASAPAVKDWPAIVGLTKATNAAATVWKPKQMP